MKTVFYAPLEKMMTPKITKQAAFNRAWDYFIVQSNPPGFDPELNNCVYYSPNYKCVIGCQLDDYQATYVIEETSFSSQPEEIKMLFENGGSELFWSDFQTAHDSAAMAQSTSTTTLNPYFKEHFTRKMIKVAKRYKLTLPPLQ